ncbi:MAG: asparaginase [Xanthomonadales bacterium]|nr:asparaginase [Xanthomonadales bacterium]
MSEKQLAVIGLGGTVAMRPVGSGAVPSLTAEDLVALLPEDASSLVHRVENHLQIPGAHLSLDDLVGLAARIRELTENAGIDGVVVVQGTDTIEETVFALEILLAGEAPVVVTGAMRHAGQVSPDGAANIANALFVAASQAAAGRGAMVCFNDEIHAAWAVQKTAATNLAAFSSPGFGPIGHVIEGRARFLCQSRRWPALDVDPAALSPARVAIVTASLGEGPGLVKAAADLDYAGLVVQATGAGHLPASWVEPLAELCKRMPVVMATRVSRGPVLSHTYAFAGSESDLLSRGLISAGFLCASKARILLSMALGAGLHPGDIRAAFGAP